ncbi:hypothetical protein [Streptomyces sp. NPDC059008]|uniref:hypothetical protein n=1 Tax=Streptomyces sp. NPDC059008 TaxID=3346693 RepID=UPI0036868E43
MREGLKSASMLAGLMLVLTVVGGETASAHDQLKSVATKADCAGPTVNDGGAMAYYSIGGDVMGHILTAAGIEAGSCIVWQDGDEGSETIKRCGTWEQPPDQAGDRWTRISGNDLTAEVHDRNVWSALRLLALQKLRPDSQFVYKCFRQTNQEYDYGNDKPKERIWVDMSETSYWPPER